MSCIKCYFIFGIACFILVSVSMMIIHTLMWVWKKYKNDDDVSKTIFIIATVSMMFAIIYALNWCLILIWNSHFPVSNHICFYEWLNDAVYTIAKGFMYLVFFVRLYKIFAGSVYQVNKYVLLLLSGFGFIFFLTITSNLAYSAVKKFLALDSTIDTLNDCGPFSNLFVDFKYNDMYSYTSLSVVFIIVELTLSFILLRLIVSRLLKLYIKRRLQILQQENALPQLQKIPSSNREKFKQQKIDNDPLNSVSPAVSPPNAIQSNSSITGSMDSKRVPDFANVQLAHVCLYVVLFHLMYRYHDQKTQ